MELANTSVLNTAAVEQFVPPEEETVFDLTAAVLFEDARLQPYKSFARTDGWLRPAEEPNGGTVSGAELASASSYATHADIFSRVPYFYDSAHAAAKPWDAQQPSLQLLQITSFGHFRSCFDFGTRGDYRNFYDKFAVSSAASYYATSQVPSYLGLQDRKKAEFCFVPPGCTQECYENYSPF
ncbi:MAG: hypothetical protein ACRD3W_11745, partial [Terriglobales bacterium]